MSEYKNPSSPQGRNSKKIERSVEVIFFLFFVTKIALRHDHQLRIVKNLVKGTLGRPCMSGPTMAQSAKGIYYNM